MQNKCFGMLLLLSASLPCMAQTAGAKKPSASVVTATDSKTYVARLEQFVKQVDACDTLSNTQKEEVSATYKRYLAEYKVVKDSLSDDDIRACSKQKTVYQKAMTRMIMQKTSDSIADTATKVGNSISKFFKKTSKQVEGTIDGMKGKNKKK